MTVQVEKAPSELPVAEALRHLLFADMRAGCSVLLVKKVLRSGKAHVERHALDVHRPAEWLRAAEVCGARRMQLKVFPWLYSRDVLAGIGSVALKVSEGNYLVSHQRTLALAWAETPSASGYDAVVAAGGHVLRAGSDHWGLIRLAEPRALSTLGRLTRGVAASVGATALGYRSAISMPGCSGAEFLTDPARVLSVPPVEAEALAAAGVRPVAPRPR